MDHVYTGKRLQLHPFLNNVGFFLHFVNHKGVMISNALRLGNVYLIKLYITINNGITYNVMNSNSPTLEISFRLVTCTNVENQHKYKTEKYQ